MQIHPSAVVSPQARLGRNVVIGPFCVVEEETEIGEGCRLESRVVVKRGTTLGRDNHVFDGATLGGLPQHVHMPERCGQLVIGAHNCLREYVTIHRALRSDAATRIGDRNLLMVNVHIAHDCTIGDQAIVANNALIGGHVAVADRAYVSAAVAIHQFCRVGSLAMVGGQAHVTQDVPPYVTVDGNTTQVVGLNLIGLRRAGFVDADILSLKAAYRLIYRSGLRWVDMLERLANEFVTGPAASFAPFFHSGKRGFVQERRGPVPATLRIAEPAASEATTSDAQLKRAG
ncbi:MAG: acyl-ACP--UDP-N-acetylglucosamine O-acyltransferase [Pirellulales bacterium]